MNEWVKRHGLVLLAYVAIGTALYWPALNAFFLSDDFEFLGIVTAANSWLVIFEPLVDRFIRPTVVAMYYVCYHVFGLSPWPYHLATLAPHFVTTAFLYVLALRLFGDRFRAVLAGLLFTVFSAHSEDVAWAAGIADPLAAQFLLLSLVAYVKACDPGASAGFVVLSLAAACAGAMSKEVWVVFPGIVFAYAVLAGERTPLAVRRTAIVLIGLAVILAGYLAMRHAVFGSIAGGYSGLGTSFGTGNWGPQIRAFIMRCFVPAGKWGIRFWMYFDWIAAAVLAALALRARGRDLRIVAFATVAMLLALAPMLPMTISIATTESERFTYLATIFSSILIVGGMSAVLRHRALVAALCGILIVWHGMVLRRNTVRWRAAGEMARGIVTSFGDQVQRYDPDNRRAIFLLNLPDNLLGAYIYRRGFYPAVHLFAPAVAGSTGRTFGIATNSFSQSGDPTAAAQLGPNRFSIDVSPGSIIQPRIPSSTSYDIVSQSASRYEVRFADTIADGLVLHTTAGRVEYVGSVAGRGIPFGNVDIPADGTECAGVSVRFSGWALDDAGVTRVALSSVGADGAERSLGDAPFVAGTRPDVRRIFSWWPNSDRAEWNYQLPCDIVAAAAGGELVVRITAVDEAGHHAVLGSRTVRATR
jgi:hypothetical protein